MKFLEAARIILNLLPAIITAIKSIEEALPAGGKGAEKLALLQEIIKSIYEKSTDVSDNFDKLWPFVQPVIGSLVSFFNSFGIFKKKEEPTS